MFKKTHGHFQKHPRDSSCTFSWARVGQRESTRVYVKLDSTEWLSKIIAQGFSWSSGTIGKFKYNPTTTNGIVIWCMIQVQPCRAIYNTLGWKLPQKLTLTLIDFDTVTLPITQLWNSTVWRLILHSWWLQETMEIWVEAQLMPNSNKTHQRSVLVLGSCWPCTLDWDHWDSDFALPQMIYLLPWQWLMTVTQQLFESGLIDLHGTLPSFSPAISLRFFFWVHQNKTFFLCELWCAAITLRKPHDSWPMARLAARSAIQFKFMSQHFCKDSSGQGIGKLNNDCDMMRDPNWSWSYFDASKCLRSKSLKHKHSNSRF